MRTEKVEVANVMGSSTDSPPGLYSFEGSKTGFAGFYELMTGLDFATLPCCFEGCTNHATLGAHLWVKSKRLHSDYFFIAPACTHCNMNQKLDIRRSADGKLTYPGRLKRGTALVARPATSDSKIPRPGLERFWPRKAREEEP